jgi:hypothetical protein
MSMITEVSDISRSLWCRRDSCASEETVPFSYRGFSASQSRPTIPAEGGTTAGFKEEDVAAGAVGLDCELEFARSGMASPALQLPAEGTQRSALCLVLYVNRVSADSVVRSTQWTRFMARSPL